MAAKLFERPDVLYADKPRKFKLSEEYSVKKEWFKGQQPQGFEALKKFRDNRGGAMTCLSAPAGCGKTYLVTEFIKDTLVTRPFLKVAVTATTNKAVKVLYNCSDFWHPALKYQTIHKLLKLKERINEKTGEIFFSPDKDAKGEGIEQVQLLVIDESSMLDDSLFQYLLPHVRKGLKIIFVGDPCQVPPINSVSSIPFSEEKRNDYNIGLIQMSEIIRQAHGNPIIEFTREIRNDLLNKKGFSKPENALWDNDKGVYHLKSETISLKLLNHVFCSDNFREDANFAKVICWRNKTIAEVNKTIRTLIYEREDLDRIEEGEKIIANTPIHLYDEWGKLTLLPANEEMVVESLYLDHEDINDGQFKLPFHQTTVVCKNFEGESVRHDMKILTYEGLQIHQMMLDYLKKVALAVPSGDFKRGEAWGNYYECMREYADITYNYAISVHKSQGSTYENAIVLAWDINANRKVYERNRILYTACTRPRHRLFIYK
jgi:exodeoxyribonuclease-5